ncbi:Putative Cellulose-binding domain, fungal, pectate lyase PlyH/PlyE, pectin lyase/virulence factor [Colletotrichum destructivum]|uniref:Pectate lyase n=1 Tax=Colletotrichum destructivum TaxID=34406 RepID=A0AAX4J0I9_9PEZI|nr:Putative Cellulose-binding domain, fungal, pectate lyase PlyH/PlyE, pectin lyase/virulence factor [Colletotrichum destructivum]
MKTSVFLSLSALSAVAVSQATLYGQCGGQGWTGPTTCVSGARCVSYNDWYSQCVTGADEDVPVEEEEEPPVSGNDDDDDDNNSGGDCDVGATPSAPQISTVEPTAVPSSTPVAEAPATTSAAETEPVVSETAAATATSSAAEEEEDPVPTSAPATTLVTATQGPTTVIAVPSGVTKTLPQSSGAVATDEPIAVTGDFDGGMKLYDRSPAVCKDQSETGEKDAMFVLEDGATLSNVIIGPGQAEGVHCKGTCTLINVWHSDVCEDAITLKQDSGSSTIIGGGAFKASDKVVQFNGRGTVTIRDFYVEDYGKLVRNCGNCKQNGGPRNVIIENVVAVDGGVLCGINTNYGDTCTVKDTCQNAGKTCDRYEGNDSGAEPKKIGSGPDAEFCSVSGLSETC